MNPPVGYGSSKPSCAKRSNASRIGVRETPTRLARGASESRSPGANSPFRIISRTHSSVREICESASDVTLGDVTLGKDTVSLSPTLPPPSLKNGCKPSGQVIQHGTACQLSDTRIQHAETSG